MLEIQMQYKAEHLCSTFLLSHYLCFRHHHHHNRHHYHSHHAVLKHALGYIRPQMIDMYRQGLKKCHPGQVDFPSGQVAFSSHLTDRQGMRLAS